MIIVLFLAGLLWILIGIFLMVTMSMGRISVTNKLGDFGAHGVTMSLVTISIGIILVGLSSLD